MTGCESAVVASPVTPSDTLALSPIPDAIFVGTAGNITGRLRDSASDVLLKNIPNATELDYEFLYIRATGTTAADIVALYKTAPELSTPTLTNYSALGAAPVVLQISTADYVAGLRGQLQIATDSGFTSISQNIVFFIDGDSWARLDESIGLTSPSGTYYACVRILKDNEGGSMIVTDQLGNTFTCDASSWSTTFTDTINTSIATWVGTTGTDKSQYLTASNGNLTLTMNNSVNANCGCRATISASGKRYFETTVVSHGTESNGSIALGITDDSTALGAATFPRPGDTGGSGGGTFRLKNGATATDVFRNGAQATGTALSTALADGDKLGISFDTTANTIKLSHKPGSGAWYDVQTITLTSQIPANWRAYSAGFGRTGAGPPYDAWTSNFGATSFSRTLDAGYQIYG